MSTPQPSQRPWWKRLGYFFLWFVLRGMFVGLSRFRVADARHLPSSGGVLICSNHQSHFDPVIVGICFPRRLNYLARRSLFRFPIFNWLIAYLDAIPIEREGMGIGGIKETLRRLKRGELVLIFPEGTRTEDGRVAPLRPGFYSIARRSNCPILPVAIAGAYEVWPENRALPGLGRIAACVGEPITAEQIRDMDEQGLIQELSVRLRACHQKAARMAGVKSS